MHSPQGLRLLFTLFLPLHFIAASRNTATSDRLPVNAVAGWGSAMNSESVEVAAPTSAAARSDRVTLAPWVNEPLLPWSELLSSHDVARLTRRPRWLLHALALIGRFPKKRCSRGRGVAWVRADILEWMSRGLAVEAAEQERNSAPRFCARRHPRQCCLPLECASGCTAPRNCSTHRPVASCNTRRRDRALEKAKHDHDR